MTRPLVTVVTPTYERRDLLAETVESVLAQAYRPLQCLVVDDGSTDGTADWLARRGRELTVLQTDHRGEARAVQHGVAHAEGDYVMIVNSDDPLLPGAIERQVDLLQARPDLIASYPDWQEIDVSGRPGRAIRADDFDLASMLLRHRAAGPGALVRREAMQRAGVRDPRYRFVSDLAFWLRLGLLGRAERLPATLATSRRHPAALSIAERGAEMAAEQVSVIEDFFARAELPGEIAALRGKALAAAHYAAALILLDVDARAAREQLRRSLRLAPGRFTGDERSHGVLLAGAVVPATLLPVLRRWRRGWRADDQPSTGSR